MPSEFIDSLQLLLKSNLTRLLLFRYKNRASTAIQDAKSEFSKLISIRRMTQECVIFFCLNNARNRLNYVGH